MTREPQAAGDQSATKTMDRWADWLVHGRQRGYSDSQLKRLQRGLDRLRDRVLSQARLKPGERVLDVGAGTGLVALGARRRVKASGLVAACDVSHDALSACRRQGEADQDGGRLVLVVGDALRLPFLDATFDVVTTRSVLIYLEDKLAGIRELHRVLKPGGRVAIFEPINEASEQAGNRLRGTGFYDTLQPELGRIRAYYEENKAEWVGTLLGWDERDLCRWFEDAGFSSVKMTYELGSATAGGPRRKPDIAAGLQARPNPNTPSYEEVAREVLGDAADDYLDRYARFHLEHGTGPTVAASVYLVARR